jgi:hypothetical protein
MKRILLIALLVCTGALGGKYLCEFVSPRINSNRCCITWLQTQLQLSEDQSGKVGEIHARLLPRIEQAKDEDAKSPSNEGACRKATLQLINEVSAVLTPAQREKYLRLVSPCSSQQEGKNR